MAQKGSNIWDVANKGIEGALKAAVANQNAQNTLKSQLLLYKIKQQFEERGEEKKAKTKFGYDLARDEAKSKLLTPYQKWAMEEYQKQETSGGGGSRRIIPGAKGFTTKQTTPKIPTKRESALYQQKIFKEYLGQLYAQSPETKGIEKLPFINSKREIILNITKGNIPQDLRTDKGKLDVQKLFSKLGVTPDDFKNFAMENFPDEAKKAFPETDEEMLKERLNY